MCHLSNNHSLSIFFLATFKSLKRIYFSFLCWTGKLILYTAKNFRFTSITPFVCVASFRSSRTKNKLEKYLRGRHRGLARALVGDACCSCRVLCPWSHFLLPWLGWQHVTTPAPGPCSIHIKGLEGVLSEPQPFQKLNNAWEIYLPIFSVLKK